MKIFSFFTKSLKENLRDWCILCLTLVMAPIYVFITYASLGAENQTYHLAISNLDQGILTPHKQRFNAGKALTQKILQARYTDHTKIFKVNFEKNSQNATQLLKNHIVQLYLVIPHNFSKILNESIENNSTIKPKLVIYGDQSNPKYMMARILVDTSIYNYLSLVTKYEIPLELESKPIKNTKAPTMFGSYIPGLLALSLLSLIFTGAASLIKEVDKGTLKRLKISRLKPIEFISALSLVQALLSIPVLLLTYLTANLLGYHSDASLFNLILVGLISSFSITALGLIIASFINTIFELMTIGALPYFVLLFFSGAWFPMPEKILFQIGNHPITWTNLLPLSHTIAAMNKILNYRATFKDLYFELSALIALTLCYYAIGLWLFTKKHFSTTLTMKS